MRRKNSKNPLVIALAIVVLAAALIGGGVYGLKAYNRHQADKIYSTADTVQYPNFSLTLTKAELRPVDLPIMDNLVQQYGGLNKDENCDAFSKAATNTMIAGQVMPYGPSDYNLCNRRNDSRKEIKKYSDANHQLVIDYKITAKATVKAPKISIKLIPDSGRKLDEQVLQFNGNAFMSPDSIDSGGIRYASSNDFEYKPFKKSDLGSDIGKGLTRTGYMYTDVRNNESSTDFVLTYYDDGTPQTRTVRIDLTKK
jgi:hypothetical protein